MVEGRVDQSVPAAAGGRLARLPLGRASRSDARFGHDPTQIGYLASALPGMARRYRGGGRRRQRRSAMLAAASPPPAISKRSATGGQKKNGHSQR